MTHTISDATLDMEIASFEGQTSLHARDMYAALVELKAWRSLTGKPDPVAPGDRP